MKQVISDHISHLFLSFLLPTFTNKEMLAGKLVQLFKVPLFIFETILFYSSSSGKCQTAKFLAKTLDGNTCLKLETYKYSYKCF